MQILFVPFLLAFASAASENICNSVKLNVFENGNSTKSLETTICREQCVEILDVCNFLEQDPNCLLYSRLSGFKQLSSCEELQDNDDIFVVKPNELFFWPGYSIGHKITVDHVLTPTGHPLTLETLSLNPLVFKISNFFTNEEAELLIKESLELTNEANRLKRSSVGSGYNVNSKRTSENAFNTETILSVALKKRSFQLLRVDPYDETYSDGIQVLRYNQTKAYIEHMDYLNPTDDHNYESFDRGTNRFATVLMYLTDVEDGGETVFVKVDKEGQPVHSNVLTDDELKETDEYLVKNNLTELFPSDSWEKKMVGRCRSRLSIKPKKAEAVLFYSQTPSGRPNFMSEHGGCPVLKGEKWAANVWVWNGPRAGYTTVLPDKSIVLSSLGENYATRTFREWKPVKDVPLEVKVQVTFKAAFGVEDAYLFWEDVSFGKLSANEMRMDSFSGHQFTVRVRDKVVQTWTISSEKEQAYTYDGEEDNEDDNEDENENENNEEKDDGNDVKDVDYDKIWEEL